MQRRGYRDKEPYFETGRILSQVLKPMAVKVVEGILHESNRRGRRKTKHSQSRIVGLRNPPWREQRRGGMGKR